MDIVAAAVLITVLAIFVVLPCIRLHHNVSKTLAALEEIEYKLDWYIQETLRFNEASPYVKHHGINKLWTPPARVLRNARKGDRK